VIYAQDAACVLLSNPQLAGEIIMLLPVRASAYGSCLVVIIIIIIIMLPIKP
jgi:hypothetical protein